MENSSHTDNTYPMTLERILIGNAYLWTTLLLGIPYIICWNIIKKQKQIFDESFRLFVLNMGVAEMLELLVLGLYPALVCLLPVDAPYWLSKFLGAFGGLGWNSYAASAQMVSLNRFASIYWPRKWTKIHTRKWTLFIMAICWSYGAMWLALYSVYDVTLMFKVAYGGLVYDLNQKYSMTAFFMNSIANWIHAISLSILYSLIYLKARKKVTNVKASRTQINEKRILLQSLIICSADVVIIFMWSVVQNFQHYHYTIFITSLFVVIAAGINAYVYLFMNKPIMDQFKKIFSPYMFWKMEQTTSAIQLRRPSSENTIKNGNLYYRVYCIEIKESL